MTKRCTRVLIVVQNMSFSYDTRVQNIARSLGKSGYRVRVFCPRYRGDPRTAEIDGVRVRFIRWPDLGPSLAAHLVEYACSIPALTIYAIGAALRRGVDVVHFCNPPDLFFGLAALFRLGGKAVVFDQHDSWPELFAARSSQKLVGRLVSACTRASLATADEVFVTSDGALPAAFSRGADPARTTLLRNGVKREVLGQTGKEDPELVGYLGNMNPQDGLTELVEAARCIRYDHLRPKVRFLCIGDGTSLPSVREKVRSLGLEQSVILTGRLAPKEARRLLGRCAVFMQPDPPNPFTRISVMAKSLEYMALGKPVVAFDLAETRRVCGGAAVYAPGEDPRSLAACVLALLDDPRRRRELGRLALERAESSFQWAHSEQVLLAVYSRLPLSRRTLIPARGRRFLPVGRARTPSRR